MFANLSNDEILAIILGVSIYTWIVAILAFKAGMKHLQNEPTFDEEMSTVPGLLEFEPSTRTFK